MLALLLHATSRSYGGRNVWGAWQESRELRRPAYSERVYPLEPFRTRANTWSNLAYVLVGFYSTALGCYDLMHKRPLIGGYLLQTPAMSVLFGAACCYLGFGSGLFHASLTRNGQQLDVAAMYSPLLVLIAMNVGRLYPGIRGAGGSRLIPTWPILAGLVVLTSVVLYRYKWSMSSAVVLPALILIVAFFGVWDRFQVRCKMAAGWLALAAIALVGARICWQLDVAGRFSGPDSWLQGHAWWHLLTSMSLGCMYLYHRSELNLSQPHN